MLRIENPNVASVEASTKVRPFRATIVLTITTAAYSAVIRNATRNNIEKIVRDRRIPSSKVVILIVIKARDISRVLSKTSSSKILSFD